MVGLIFPFLLIHFVHTYNVCSHCAAFGIHTMMSFAHEIIVGIRGAMSFAHEIVMYASSHGIKHHTNGVFHVHVASLFASIRVSLTMLDCVFPTVSTS